VFAMPGLFDSRYIGSTLSTCRAPHVELSTCRNQHLELCTCKRRHVECSVHTAATYRTPQVECPHVDSVDEIVCLLISLLTFGVA